MKYCEPVLRQCCQLIPAAGEGGRGGAVSGWGTVEGLACIFPESSKCPLLVCWYDGACEGPEGLLSNSMPLVDMTSKPGPESVMIFHLRNAYANLTGRVQKYLLLLSKWWAVSASKASSTRNSKGELDSAAMVALMVCAMCTVSFSRLQAVTSSGSSSAATAAAATADEKEIGSKDEEERAGKKSGTAMRQQEVYCL